jgi:hypothetical protein
MDTPPYKNSIVYEKLYIFSKFLVSKNGNSQSSDQLIDMREDRMAVLEPFPRNRIAPLIRQYLCFSETE